MSHPLTFQERREYSSVSPHPHISIPVSLSVGSERVDLLAKIDTGAPYCVFERLYGERLGLDLERGIRLGFTTTTGGAFTAYGHTVSLETFGFTHECVVYFQEDETVPRNLLGMLGWIDRFRLGLIDHDSLLFLSRYDD